MIEDYGRAHIGGISFFTPEGTLSNRMLSDQFPEWSVNKIGLKTGIDSRQIARTDEYSSTMAIEAANLLFSKVEMFREDLDYIILCTQTPDFLLPTTACLVHRELGLRQKVGAIDVNQGCSGYVYSLGLAKGLIESGQAENVLVLTADTYSKLLNPADKSVRTIFGDGATATAVLRSHSGKDLIGPFSYGTDGSGAHHLMTTRGGIRSGETLSPKVSAAARLLEESSFDLYMNGPEIFNFTLREVPGLVEAVLTSAGLALEDVDLVVPHQANAFMLTHLREKLGIPKEKFVIDLADFGNTVSSTIPIALARLDQSGLLFPGMKILLLGFGVGLSWAGCVITWK